MIIDFHTHIYPEIIAKKTVEMLGETAGEKPSFDGTDTGLISEMKQENIDICVALPVMLKPSNFDTFFNFALGINEKYKYSTDKRIISFAGIHPLCDDLYNKMKLIKDSGFLGVKIHPDYQGLEINDECYIKLIKYAKDLDLIVVTHAGFDFKFKDCKPKCTPNLVKEVIDKVNHNKFILAHMGGILYWDDCLNLLAGRDVYFDTAFSVNPEQKEIFCKILDKHGDDKILFGSDSSMQNIKQTYEKLLNFNLPKESLDKILYKNACKLLHLGE